MKRPHWTQSELDHLTQLVGDFHITKLTGYYNSWAVRNGYPRRTERAIKDRIQRLGLSRRPEGTWLVLMDVARILGRSPMTIRNWIKRGWIPDQYVQRPSPQMTLIHRNGMNHLARTQPEVLASCSLYSLLATLGSEPLAEQVHEQLQGQRWTSQHHAVQCVETGRRYPSIQAAARANFITPNTIRFAIKRGWKAADKHWRSIGPAPIHAQAIANHQH